MSYKRLIPCIFIKDGKAVRWINDPTVVSKDVIELAKYYSDHGADELIVLDLSDSDEEHDETITLMKRINRVIRIPMIAGGNIRRKEDIKKILYTGAKRAMLNFSKPDSVKLIEDAARQLEQRLSETDYEAWRKRQWLIEKKDPYRMIQKYLKSHSGSGLSEDMIENIRELSKITYSTLSNNSLVRSELFCDQPEGKTKATGSDVHSMTMKHLSDLLNVANQKEIAVKVIAAMGQLEALPAEESCPAEVKELLKKLMR